MKRSRGFSFLAIGVLVGAIGVVAAFWNLKSKVEEVPKVAEPTAPYAGVTT